MFTIRITFLPSMLHQLCIYVYPFLCSIFKSLFLLLRLQADNGLLKSTTQVYCVESTFTSIHFSALYLNLYSKSIQCTTLPTTPLYRSMDFVTHHSLWIYLIDRFIFRSLFYQIMDFIAHHSLWIDPSLYSNLYSISYWTL